MKNKDTLTLLVALALPVILIIAMVLYLYLPRLFVKPAVNFIFTNESTYTSNLYYKVVNNRLTIKDLSVQGGTIVTKSNQPNLYLYDVTSNEVSPVSYTQAMGYLLSTSQKSPDGFEIVHGDSGGSFPFDYSSGNYYSRYLKKNGYSQKLNLDDSITYNFNFLGWVVQNDF